MLNGSEIGGGSIRIHDAALQARIFKRWASRDEEAKLRFGFFLEALEYGTPPHGGIALGLDRIVAILARRGVDPRGHRVPEDRQRGRSDGRRAVVGRRRTVAELHLKRTDACYTSLDLNQESDAIPIPTTAMRKSPSPKKGIETLFGSYDENLKHLESLFNVRIRTQGHDLLVEGDTADLDRVDRVVGQLPSLMRDGFKLSNADVKTAAELVAQDDARRSRAIISSRAASRAAGKRRVAPKTVNQRRYLDAIEQHDIVFGIGPAGTGKTYLAMAQAVAFLVAKKVSRIILARPAVEAGEKLGFLPGDLQEKVNPYLRPLYDALYDMLDVERVGALHRARHDRDRADRVHARPHAERRVRHPRRGAEHHVRADEDVPDAARLRLEGGDHRRHHADRPADRPHLRPGRGDEGGRQHRGHRVRPLRRPRRRAPQAGAADRQGVRGVTAHADRGDDRSTPRLPRGRQRRPRPRACRRARARRAGCRASRRPAARGEVGVALVSDARVRALNRSTAARTTRPTSSRFAGDRRCMPAAMPEPPGFLGDIVIARGVAARQAREAGHSDADRAAGPRAARPAAPARLRSRAR